MPFETNQRIETVMADQAVVDASTLVDALVDAKWSPAIRARLEKARLFAPAHVDSEVLSALGRLCRADIIKPDHVDSKLAFLAAMPLRRQMLPPLLPGAWSRRGNLRLTDALYVELASQLDAPVVTTDQRLARATPLAEAIEV